MSIHSKRITVAAIGACLLLTATASVATPASLTLFHNNDGESRLLGSNGFGGFAQFLGELEHARDAVADTGRDVLTISSGDNFLAGIAFEASQNRRDQTGGLGSSYGADSKSNNYYDALALATVGYDAITLGNHDFDFGPEVLADFINGYTAAGGRAPFLSANLDVSGQTDLNALATSTPPLITSSTVVTGRSGEVYGIIGATTETLDNVSSPGPDVIINDVATAIQQEVSALQDAGINKIILSSHLQGLSNEQALAPLLTGVDIIIAGGGDELLANEPDALSSNPFQPNIEGPYPVVVDRDGQAVPIVTTVGEYRYVGQLNVEFDADGHVTEFAGDPILVDPNGVDPHIASGDRITAGGVTINLEADIIDPLLADDAEIRAQVIGTTEVFLNGVRNDIRSQETNLGNLIADGFVFAAQQLGGLDPDAQAVIGLTNGGGIRAAVEAGEVSNANIIAVLPFANSLVVLNEFSVEDLVSALENAVSSFPETNGAFLQISGMSYDFDSSTGKILRIVLDNGSEIYNALLGGILQDITMDIVTNSFIAAGGDGYDEFARYTATDLGISYAEALRIYIRGGLSGAVTTVQYGGSSGRINAVSAVSLPTSLVLLLSGLGGLAWVRRH